MAYLNGILGDVGSGKTALMTRYAKLAADDGVKVISNYPLIGIPHQLMSFEEFRGIVSNKNTIQQVRGCTVMWDELGVGADSYEFFQKDVKEISDFCFQMRKLHVNAYYTAQRLSTVARRIRIMTGAFIGMRDIDAHIMVDRHGRRVRLHREVCQGIFEMTMRDEFLERIGEPQYFNGKNYFQYYNTDTLIWA